MEKSCGGPSKVRDRVVEELHETHPGICRMKLLARSHVWWSKMDADLEKRDRQCVICQVSRNFPPEDSLHPWELPPKPCIRLHLNFAGPFVGKNVPHRN